MKHNLRNYDDWIVTNSTLRALGVLRRRTQGFALELIPKLREYRMSDRKSVASLARALLAELGASRAP